MKRKIAIFGIAILAIFLLSAGIAAARATTNVNSSVNTIQTVTAPNVTTPAATDSVTTGKKVDINQTTVQNSSKQLQNNTQGLVNTTTPFSLQPKSSAQGASTKTHVGQPVSNLVLLCKNERREPYQTYYGFVQIFPDGEPPLASFSTSYDYYSIPQGYTLIVTDVDWRVEGGAPGKTAALQLHIAPLDVSYLGNYAFSSSAILDSSGCGGASVSMTTGFAVSSSARLIATSYPNNNSNMKQILVRGYLVPSN
ncbi:MAG: hypothetical protein ACOY46_14055 [Bacillota bacterium]